MPDYHIMKGQGDIIIASILISCRYMIQFHSILRSNSDQYMMALLTLIFNSFHGVILYIGSRYGEKEIKE